MPRRNANLVLKLDLEILAETHYKDKLVLISDSRTPAIRRSAAQAWRVFLP
jgi:hypothetical protein